MYECKVGRLDITVELNTPNILGNNNGINGYDLVASENGEVKKIYKNVYGRSEYNIINSKEFEYITEFANRYTVLADTLDMANHNLMCYSTNLLMDTPKPEYADQWHKEHNRVIVLEQMIKELPHTVYMPINEEE